MPSGFPVLTPAYGLGSNGRTGVAINISSPRTRLGSQAESMLGIEHVDKANIMNNY